MVRITKIQKKDDREFLSCSISDLFIFPFIFFFCLKSWLKRLSKRNSVFSSFHLNCFYARKTKKREDILCKFILFYLSFLGNRRRIDKILIKMNFHAVYQLAPMVCKRQRIATHIWSTSARGPCIFPSIVPDLVFFTQPQIPNCWHISLTYFGK